MGETPIKGKTENLGEKSIPHHWQITKKSRKACRAFNLRWKIDGQKRGENHLIGRSSRDWECGVFRAYESDSRGALNLETRGVGPKEKEIHQGLFRAPKRI